MLSLFFLLLSTAAFPPVRPRIYVTMSASYKRERKTPAQTHDLGLPARAGNLLSFTPPLLPDAASLEQMITPVTIDPLEHGRHIEANFVSFNIGAIADKPYTQGITAVVTKIAMLSA